MIYITAPNIFSAAKKTFLRLYNKKEISQDPKLWKEDSATIVINGDLRQRRVFLKLNKKGDFCYFFKYKSFFPHISSKLIKMEIDHWQKEFLKSSRLKKILKFFHNNPLTKRGIVLLWHDKYLYTNKDVPCLSYLSLRKKKDKLEAHAHMRANNACFLLFMDMQILSGIHHIIAKHLNLKRGAYVHHVDVLLFFKRDIDNIKKQYDFIKNSLSWRKIK